MTSGGPWDSPLAPWDDPGGHQAAAGSPWAIWINIFERLGCVCSYELMSSYVSGLPDALDQLLCSEFAQGRVEYDPPLVFFCFLICCPGRGTCKDGLTADA